MKKYLYLGILFICLVAQNAKAQSFFTFKNGKEKQKIHFKLYRNIIVFPVFVNGKGPYNFILDSGAGNCIITSPDLFNDLDLIKGKEILIKGNGNEENAKAFLTHFVTIEIENIESLPLTMPAFEKDPFFLSQYLGVDIHGILGFEFFNSFAIKINYQNQVITITESTSSFNLKHYSKVGLEIRNKKPFIYGTGNFMQNNKVDLDLLIDTGAGFPISLEEYSNPKIEIPIKHVYADLGVGLNGVISGKIARVPSIEIQNYVFTDIVTAYPDYQSTGIKQFSEFRNGSIGNFILNRFTLIFDYAHQLLLLKPNAKMNDPFPYDRTGLEIIATGDSYIQFIVKTVKENSPAEEIGIQVGDEIVEINFRKITTYTLSEIDHILSNRNSNSVTLRIKRESVTYFMLIELEDLI